MDVIFVLPCFYSPDSENSTGGTISNYILVNIIAKHLPVKVIVPEGFCQLDEKLHSNVSILEVKISDFRLKMPNIIRYKELGDELSRHLEMNYGKVYAFFCGATNSISSKFLKNKNTYVLLLVRAYDDFLYGEWSPIKKSVKSGLKYVSDFGVTKKCFSEADAIVTNSNWMVGCIKRAFPKSPEASVLYPPIDVKRNSVPTSRQDRTVGVVVRGDGTDKGISLVRELANLNREVIFQVYGNFDLKKSKVESLDNVLFKGWQPREIMYEESALFLVPSKWPEPFGRTSVEAQLAGLPVLVSGSGGLPETVLDDYFVVSCYLDWNKKLDEIFKNYSKWEQFVKLNRNVLDDKFSLTAHEKRILTILRSL